jgi:hypothetical protein
MDTSNMRSVTRRQFVAGAGATAAGIALSGAADAQAPLILGSGSHRFEWVPEWLKPPADIKWGDTQGVAQDSKGRIYISHTVGADSIKKDAIVVFDKNGKFLTSWGSRFAGGGHGLDVRREGKQEFLYHCDTAHRQVVKTTLDGSVVWEKGFPVESGVYKQGMNFVPTNVAFNPDGDLYIGDGYGSHYVLQYDKNGNFKRAFGGHGKEPGKLDSPHGLWLDTRLKEPLLAVADRSSRRIQYFTQDGKHVKFETNGMRLPCHFHIRGDEMLVPDLQSVVTILDGENKVIAHLGDGAKNPGLRGKPSSEFIPGQFIHPHGAKFLNNGDILVVEWVPQGRVTLLRKLKPEGGSTPRRVLDPYTE